MMKASTLINKLKKLPPDTEIVVDNNDVYVPGIYKATTKEIDYYPDENIVVIGTDYKYKLEDGKWI